MTTIEQTDARVVYEREHAQPDEVLFEPVGSEDDDYASAPPDYKIINYPADYTLEVLCQKMSSREINIPAFQRDFVWNQPQASKLIESFLVGLPVPPVYLYKDAESEDYLVIDGQQRLKSIVQYFKGHFGEEHHGTQRVFRLTGLSPDSQFANKTFAELNENHQRRLSNAVLRSFIVQQTDPSDDTSMYQIFERLNTGGTHLANQEIRNCIYHGRLVESIAELNVYPSWRELLGKVPLDRRRKDMELLVRFFAMRDRTAYRKPMKDFLSRFMKLNRHASDESVKASSRLFRDTCDSIITALGEKPFHVRNGLNVAVADSVMAAFSQHLDSVPPDVLERYNALNELEDYVRTTTMATTDVDTIRERFELAERRLFD